MKLRNSLKYIKEKINHPFIALEIGVAKAENSLSILTVADKLYLIDSFVESIDLNFDGSVLGGYKNDRTNTLIDCYKNILPHIQKNKAILIMQYAHNVVDLFPDNFFDYIYIDGNHSYEQIKRDLKLWFPKCKKWFSGHDFHPNYPPVQKAVKEFSDKHKLCLIDLKPDWLIEK